MKPLPPISSVLATLFTGTTLFLSSTSAFPLHSSVMYPELLIVTRKRYGSPKVIVLVASSTSVLCADCITVICTAALLAAAGVTTAKSNLFAAALSLKLKKDGKTESTVSTFPVKATESELPKVFVPQEPVMSSGAEPSKTFPAWTQSGG